MGDTGPLTAGSRAHPRHPSCTQHHGTPSEGGRPFAPCHQQAVMTATMQYPRTRQGVRELDHPVRPSGVNIGPKERDQSAAGISTAR